MVREFEYKGRRIQTTVLPQEGRWAYRIDGGDMYRSKDIRAAARAEVLFDEAERAAKAHIDGADRRDAVRAERDAKG